MKEDFTPTAYTLECVATGRELPDEGWTLDDRQCKTPSLVRTRYEQKVLRVRDDACGFYKLAVSFPDGRP